MTLSGANQTILNQALIEALCVDIGVDRVDESFVGCLREMGAIISKPDDVVKKCIDNTGNLRFLLDFLKKHYPSDYESLRSNNNYVEHALTSNFYDDDVYSNLIGYVSVLLEYEFGLKSIQSPPLVNAGANPAVLKLLIEGGANPLDECEEKGMNGLESILEYDLPKVLEMALRVIKKDKLEALRSSYYFVVTAMNNYRKHEYEESCVKILLDNGFKPREDSLIKAACYHQDPKLVEALVKAGVEMQSNGKHIFDSLDKERIQSDEFNEIVRILAANGAKSDNPVLNALAGHIRDISNMNVWAETAAFYASRTRHDEPPLKRRRRNTTD